MWQKFNFKINWVLQEEKKTAKNDLYKSFLYISYINQLV
jgi:hypothetical protein